MVSQVVLRTYLSSGGSRPSVWGGRQKGLHLLKYQRLSATIVVCHTNEVTFCRP